ncbi:hypothetical protein CEQ90_05550 [Lewinellaceae bacterium SD302]|nr:hypothetical protein CEQ90_05550 [Lewinellaceae bacterium SD302]
MKHFCAILLFSFAFTTGLYSQSDYESPYSTSVEDDSAWPGSPNNGVNPFEDGINTTNPNGGGGPAQVQCSTVVVLESETVFPCGSGYGTEIVYSYTCVSGNTGSCTSGIRITFEGCFDGELGEEVNTLTTQNCN